MNQKTFLEDLKNLVKNDKTILHYFIYPDVIQKLVKNNPEKYIIGFQKHDDCMEISITPVHPNPGDHLHKLTALMGDVGLLERVPFPLVDLPENKDVPTFLQFNQREDGVFHYNLFVSSIERDVERKVDKIIYQIGKDFSFFGYGEKEFLRKVDSAYATYLLKWMDIASSPSNIKRNKEKD